MLSLMDERQLMHSLALWTMKNSRFAPQPGSCEEAAFIKTFLCPKRALSASIRLSHQTADPFQYFAPRCASPTGSRAAGRSVFSSISRLLRRTRTVSATPPKSRWATR